MYPYEVLNAMVADRRRQLIAAGSVRRAALGRPAGAGLILAVRRAVGARLIRVGQATAGTPVPVGQRA